MATTMFTSDEGCSCYICGMSHYKERL